MAGETQPESPRGLWGELSDALSRLFCNAVCAMSSCGFSLGWSRHCVGFERLMAKLLALWYAVYQLLCNKLPPNSVAENNNNHFIVPPDFMGQEFEQGLTRCFFCSLWY